LVEIGILLLAENGHGDNGRGSFWRKTVTPIGTVVTRFRQKYTFPFSAIRKNV